MGLLSFAVAAWHTSLDLFINLYDYGRTDRLGFFSSHFRIDAWSRELVPGSDFVFLLFFIFVLGKACHHWAAWGHNLDIPNPPCDTRFEEGPHRRVRDGSGNSERALFLVWGHLE